MRILKIAVIAALAFTGLAASAYADGFEPGTTSLRVPINGRTNQQICRAVQTLGILPGSINACVREARANREDGWVTLTALSGPMQIAEPTAQPAPEAAPASAEEGPGWSEPPEERAQHVASTTGTSGSLFSLDWLKKWALWIVVGVLAAGGVGWFLLRKKPEDVAVVAEEDET